MTELGRLRQLHTVVAQVDRELDSLAEQAMTDAHRGAAERLCALWMELLSMLSLGPPPELRDCPSCGQPGMRRATRCGHCWRGLVPV